MNTTGTTQTWHDLAGDLMAWQVQGLERSQADRVAGKLDHMSDAQFAGFLLDRALGYARGNAADRERFGDVPVPAGDWRVWHWVADEHPAGWARELESSTDRAVGGVEVGLQGWQFPDGRVEATVAVSVDDLDGLQQTLTAAEARELAEVIAQAADEVDRLNGVPLFGHCDNCGLEHWRGECRPAQIDPPFM